MPENHAQDIFALQDAIRNENTALLKTQLPLLHTPALLLLIKTTAELKTSKHARQIIKRHLVKQIDDSMTKIAEISNNPNQLQLTFETLVKQTEALEILDEAEGKQARYYAHCSLGHSYSIQMQNQQALDAYYAASQINPEGTTAFAGMISAATILGLKKDNAQLAFYTNALLQQFNQSPTLQANDQIRGMLDLYLTQQGEKPLKPSQEETERKKPRLR